MKHIAILTGGPSAERSISEKSASCVASYLNTKKYTHRYILMEKHGWIDRESGVAIDLNDFSLTLKGRREYFDLVLLMIHGTPAEDGKIQGYFEYLGIPHSTCNTLSASLTFNKQKCKDFLSAHEVSLAPSYVVAKGEAYDQEQMLALGLPLFVKPNNNGSSYGITKVKAASDLNRAIQHAFEFDDEAIVEAFLDGREFGCGVVKDGQQLHVFPLTEIIPETEFFTFAAKYEGASEEVTPANLSPHLSGQCQNISAKLYKLLSCRGMVRFDFILVGETFYLLEANTIPGLSEASIIPQQAVAYGWSITKLLDVVITDCLRWD